MVPQQYGDGVFIAGIEGFGLFIIFFTDIILRVRHGIEIKRGQKIRLNHLCNHVI